MPLPPKRPQKPRSNGPSTQYPSQPPEVAAAGQLFRVRDKDWEAVHGENLTYAEAHKLKETVVGQRKSRTARVEAMSVEPPDWYTEQLAEINGATSATGNAPDPELERLRAPALAASKAAAAEAQRRHAARAAADRSAPAGAKRVSQRPAVVAPLPKVPVVSTVRPEDEDDEDFIVDPDEINGLGSELAEGQKDQPTAADLARAKAKRDADAKAAAEARAKIPTATPELTARAKELYAEECARRGGGVPFEQLHAKVQGNWRLEAQKNPRKAAPEEPEPEPEPAEAADGERNDLHAQIEAMPAGNVDPNPTTVDS